MAVPATMTVAYQQPEDEGSRVLVAEMRTVPVPSLTEPTQKPYALAATLPCRTAGQAEPLCTLGRMPTLGNY